MYLMQLMKQKYNATIRTLSFVCCSRTRRISHELMLYEHQSTANPNMPLRDLFYVTDILQKRTYNKDLYSSKLIEIPAPRFVVFYNGATYQPERQILKLSDAFEKKQTDPELELTVTMYNINCGCNEEIMEACKTLKEYAIYVERLRTYAKQMPLKEAVEKAVDECIAEGILADFLEKNRAEAIKVSIYEYDEELHMKSEREIWYKQGAEEKTFTIVRNMLKRGMTDEDIIATAECAQELIDHVRADL